MYRITHIGLSPTRGHIDITARARLDTTDAPSQYISEHALTLDGVPVTLDGDYIFLDGDAVTLDGIALTLDGDYVFLDGGTDG